MTREQISERLLWGSRYIVVVAVVASIIVCCGMYIVATIDVGHFIKNIYSYIKLTNEDARSTIVTNIVEIIDGYLLATMMLVFSFGLYELFISRIDPARSNKLASRVLTIQNIDDLKERLSKLILLILIVKFFEHALKQTFVMPIDLLYFSVGIFLIGAALYLSHKKEAVHDEVIDDSEKK